MRSRPLRLLPALMLSTATALSFSALTASPALAAASCSYDTGTKFLTVMLPAVNDTATVVRSGSDIFMNGSPCAGGPTKSNTKKIVVTGGNGTQTLDIDLSGGKFQPGTPSESSGTSEIEFEIDLVAGTDQIRIIGGTSDDTITFGTDGGALNGDSDKDITPSGGGYERIRAYGGDGDDTISADGGHGTGSATPSVVYVEGDAGKDGLTGGDGWDSLYGEDGKDDLNGGEGADDMFGGDSADDLTGGDDEDELYPEAGDDTVRGGSGGDYLYTDSLPDGADDLGGGAGYDYAYFSSRTGDLKIDLDDNDDDGETGEHDNVRDDIERIDGGSGNDKVTGSEGDEDFYPGEGTDEVNAGDGDDNIYDQGTGPSNDDTLDGGGGSDYIDDGQGNDQVDGGGGSDTLTQGSSSNGADVLQGGKGSADLAYYQNRTLGVTITIDGTANDGQGGTEGDNVQTDVEGVHGGSAADTLTGSAGDESLVGNGGVDTIDGGGGTDLVFGEGYEGQPGSAGDTLTGGDGQDTLYGYDGNDTFHATDGGYDELFGGNGPSDTCTDRDVGLDFVDSTCENQ